MLQSQYLDYFDGDVRLQGYLAYDDARPGPLPAVLVAHTWAGRNDFVLDKANQLAALGYAGFALDLYGDAKVGEGAEACSALMMPFMEDRALLQRRMLAALAAVRGFPEVDAGRVAAMGFCFGGLCVLDLARTGADLRGVASFHGLLKPPGNTAGRSIGAKVLVMHGHDDPMVPVADVVALEEELTQAGADWQVHAYGHTVHAFTNPQANDPGCGTVYNAAADRRSWQSLVNFLAEVLH
jgi:dienelactone hydrolase